MGLKNGVAIAENSMYDLSSNNETQNYPNIQYLHLQIYEKQNWCNCRNRLLYLTRSSIYPGKLSTTNYEWVWWER